MIGFVKSFFRFDGRLGRVAFLVRYIVGRAVHAALCFGAGAGFYELGWEPDAVALCTTALGLLLALLLFTGIFLQRMRDAGAARDIWQFWVTECGTCLLIGQLHSMLAMLLALWGWGIFLYCLFCPAKKESAA